MSSAAELSLQKASILYNFSDKNATALKIIRAYAARHSAMDIGVGLISLAPGAAIPALIGAVALQSEAIYKPMARELAEVYLSTTDSYTDRLGAVAGAATVAIEFAQEFAIEFLAEHTRDLLLEIGLGALATTVPIAGAFVGAALDFMIAQMMTWRVGTMSAIYFQNGASWVESRKSTIAIAKGLTGGLHMSPLDLVSGLRKSKERARNVRVNLDDIPNDVPQVKRSAVNNILPLLRGSADKLPRPAVKESLLGLPAFLIDAALNAYYPTPVIEF